MHFMATFLSYSYSKIKNKLNHTNDLKANTLHASRIHHIPAGAVGARVTLLPQ